MGVMTFVTNKVVSYILLYHIAALRQCSTVYLAICPQTAGLKHVNILFSDDESHLCGVSLRENHKIISTTKAWADTRKYMQWYGSQLPACMHRPEKKAYHKSKSIMDCQQSNLYYVNQQHTPCHDHHSPGLQVYSGQASDDQVIKMSICAAQIKVKMGPVL